MGTVVCEDVGQYDYICFGSATSSFCFAAQYLSLNILVFFRQLMVRIFKKKLFHRRVYIAKLFLARVFKNLNHLKHF